MIAQPNVKRGEGVKKRGYAQGSRLRTSRLRGESPEIAQTRNRSLPLHSIHKMLFLSYNEQR